MAGSPKYLPQEYLRTTRVDNNTVSVERRGGADPSLPPVIFCHGLGGSGSDLIGTSYYASNTFSQRAINHAIASGYKFWANLTGGESAWSNPSAMSDLDTLYTLATGGNGVVIITGWSMGGCSSHLWAANNMNKIAGIVSFCGCIHVDWAYNNQDDDGNWVINTGFFPDPAAIIDTAFGGPGTWSNNKATSDPLYPSSIQLSTLRANADKVHHFIACADGVINPLSQFKQAKILHCSSTQLPNSNHNFFDMEGWDDRFLTQQLDIFSGRSAYRSYSTMIINTPGLAHYYKCDEISGSALIDSKGNEDLTTNGTYELDKLTLIAGPWNGAFDTTASTDGTAYSNPHEQIAGTSDFSYEFWFKTTSSTLGAYLVAEGSSASDTPIIGVSTSTVSAGKLRLYAQNAAGTSSADTTSVYNDGIRHYGVVVGKISEGTIELHLDGQQAASITYPPGNYGFDRFSIMSLARSTLTAFLAGSISHVAMYAVALDNGTIQQHYDNGRGYYT